MIPEGHHFILVGGWTLPNPVISQPELIRLSRHHKPEADKIWLDQPNVGLDRHPHAFAVVVQEVAVGTIDELVANFREKLIKAAEFQLDSYEVLGITAHQRQQIQAELAQEPVQMPVCKSHPYWRAMDDKYSER